MDPAPRTVKRQSEQRGFANGVTCPADRGYGLGLGRNHFTGSETASLADERVRRLYLGG